MRRRICPTFYIQHFTPEIHLSPLHPPRIRTAIRTDHMIRRHGERQQRSTFLAGNGLAVHVNREAARFAHDLLRAGEGFDVRAALSAMTLFAFMRLHFIVFCVQAVKLQEFFSISRGEVREPRLTERCIFHAQGNGL